MPELKDGCVKPARGPIVATSQTAASTDGAAPSQEIKTMTAHVGKEAPDFEANAFVANEGFETIKLSEFKGKWIVVCFHPGDFTFV